MIFDFVANVSVDGQVIQLEGETWSLLEADGPQVLNREFLDFVADRDRQVVSDILFDVEQGQAPLRFEVTLVSSSGKESDATVFAAPIFEGGRYKFTRLAAKRKDPLTINSMADSDAFNEVMESFENKLQAAIDSNQAAVMSIFSVESGDAVSTAQAGDRLHALLSERSDGEVCRISDGSSVVLHDDKTSAGDIGGAIADGMEGHGDLSTYSLDLADDTLDAASRMEMASGVLAAAAQPGVNLGSGTHKLSDGYEMARGQVTAAIAGAVPKISIAVQWGAPDTRIGMADVPELLRRWNGGGKQGGPMLQDIVRSHLEAVTRAKPEDIPVCVPIHAASLMFLDKAEWDQFDLMVMPVGLRELDEELQQDAANLLSTQYVMVDISDLVYCPAVLAQLLSAEALSFLRVDMQKTSALSDAELDSFREVYDFCSKRGIYVLVSRVDPNRIENLIERAKVIFLPDAYLKNQVQN
ncbi:hypothetical protein [Hwanghaeella sp.]|uniref:hypothetical protein n=1 Tax=Hwanghaeella sp. TaxID=2605943 RepID=UPI003CCBC122